MEITGKWNAVKFCALDQNNQPIWLPKEEYAKKMAEKGKDIGSMAMIFNAVFVITSDSMSLCLPIPEGTPTEQIVAAFGEDYKMQDGLLVAQEQKVKQEDGKWFLRKIKTGGLSLSLQMTDTSIWQCGSWGGLIDRLDLIIS